MKPIEKVQNVIENAADVFVNEKTDTKKKQNSRRTAIAVGSSVLVISALVALFNPRYSSKIMQKVKTMQYEAGRKKGKGGNIFYKMYAKALSGTVRGTEIVCNLNSGKDILFKHICTEEKQFSKIKNNSLKNILKKIDSGFRKLVSKPYRKITEFFDYMGKSTIRRKYKGALENLKILEDNLNNFKTRLPAAQKAEVDAKLKEIEKLKEYFNNPNLDSRFKEQENLMSNLEKELKERFLSYTDKSNPHHNRSRSFWAEEIVQDKRKIIQDNGNKQVDLLFGNRNGQNGAYNEITEIIRPYLNEDENMLVQKLLSKSGKKLRRANHSECTDYFDKKRDLIAGSAPTDILTAIFGLSMGGIAVTTADSKDERISRAATGVFPVIAGLGTNLALSAMLFSGFRSISYALIASFGLNRAGVFFDKHILGNNKKADNKTAELEPKEVQIA